MARKQTGEKAANGKAKDKSSKTTSRKKKATRRTKLSWVTKPEGLSLTEWQIALRKQVAEEEKFGISCVDDMLLPGEYSVKSPEESLQRLLDHFRLLLPQASEQQIEKLLK